MADVNVNIGTDGSGIEQSELSLGNVTGGNAVNLNFDPSQTDKSRYQDYIAARLESHNNRLLRLESTVANYGERLRNVEKVIGGNLGTAGLTQQLQQLRDMMIAAKEDRDEIKMAVKLAPPHLPMHPMTTTYLILATLAMLAAIAMLAMR